MAKTEIRFSGTGGQGLLLSAKILAATLAAEGRHVAQSQAYEPVSRGGLSRADLVIGEDSGGFPLSSRLDYLLILDAAAVGASDGLLDKKSVVLVDSALVPEPPTGPFTLHSLPFTETAIRLGNRRVANVVALGALVTISGICPLAALETVVKAKTPAKFAALNMEALEAGRVMAG
jgi:2-oxoglutarate ferredoxin oxidoreductase subunit gamma